MTKSISKTDDSYESRPCNHYNIYYILERERCLQSNCNYKKSKTTTDAHSSNFVTGYEHLELPALPPRYSSLDLTFDWYMPGKRKATKRSHKKSHGLVSFQELARLVADGYKSIDDVTLEYVTTVATILKQRHKELKKERHMESYAAVDSSSSSSKPNTSCDKSTQHHPKQPYHIWASFPIMSDFFVSSTTAAAAACCSPNTTTGEYYKNYFDESQEASSSPPSFGEVDIPDQDIISMWYLY